MYYFFESYYYSLRLAAGLVFYIPSTKYFFIFYKSSSFFISFILWLICIAAAFNLLNFYGPSYVFCRSLIVLLYSYITFVIL